MDKQYAMQQSLELVNKSTIAMVGSINDEGYPNIKAMINAYHEGLKYIWFSTNTSSRRIKQFIREPKTCVYFVDLNIWKGLMLVGHIEILQDLESRQRLWHQGDEKYYSQGVNDPDYSVLRFTAQWGNYYHALENVNFDIE